MQNLLVLSTVPTNYMIVSLNFEYEKEENIACKTTVGIGVTLL